MSIQEKVLSAGFCHHFEVIEEMPYKTSYSDCLGQLAQSLNSLYTVFQ